MASKLCRCIQLWLTFFLCWFVLRGDRVTQETESDIGSLFTEKENLGFTEQGATPSLVSVHQTQTIIPDIELNTLVTRPAIAPATPWDDTQVTSTISVEDAEPSIEHQIITEKQIPDVEILSPISNNEDSKSAGEKEEEIEVGGFDNGADNDMKKFIESSDVVENAESKDNISETSSEEASDKDGGELEKVEDSEEKRQVPEGVENVELPENQQFSLNEEEKIASKKEILDDSLPPASESSTHKVDSNIQTLQVDEALTGTQDGLEATQEDLEGAQDTLGVAQEDMPSFSEWSQKFLAQEEEKKVQLNNEKGTSDPGIIQKKKTMDRKQNNYASVDCGANIPEKNNEAQNAHSILLENKDLYMLNPCSANIWFIVELCDHVQVTSLQLANFEMFSSTTRKFQVSFSTRYPTREWSQLQTFEAKPEKSIQTFTLDPIFAKYIKVEQLTHHGSEHYCPWSLLRVYGNSMVEEYEEHESSSQDENTNIDEDLNTSSNTTENKNQDKGILKSATDAVLNFVKETAKKLVKTEDEKHSTDNASNATTYREDNSTQPLQPKAIVQLMPREDFEASCNENGDDAPNTCLHGDECVSPQYLPHSYQGFLEIVHNVCGRNFKRAEACFTNVSKILAANATNKKASQENLTKEIQLDSSGNKEEVKVEPVVGDHLGDSENKSNDEGYSKDSGNNVDDVTVSIEKLQKPEDIRTSSRIGSSQESKASESVHVDTQTSQDSTITSTALHTSICSNCVSRNSVPSATISGSVTSSINDLDFASSPTPLAQPPLAMNDNPNMIEPPTPPPQGIEKEIIIQESSDSPNSAPCDNLDCITVTETTPIAVPSSSSTLHESMPTSSSIVESGVQVLEKISTAHQDAPVVDEGSYRDNNLPEGSNRNNNEDDEGTRVVDKEHDEVQNPHVDVLKTTLTDAETKEGRAEPEQPNEDIASDLMAKANKTVINQLEEGKEMEKLDIDVGSKGKEVETHKQDELELGGEVKGEEETVEEQKDAVVLNEDHKQTELPDPSLVEQDLSLPSAGQCQMKDSTVSKNPEDVGSPNLDPGPTISAETAPTQSGNGNANGKKESIFVTLSRKIKALEQNVTMTNLFLEELSQRYRKSMDEVQKKMEKKFSMLSKNSKLLTKVNLSQNSTILALTGKVKDLEEKLNEAISRLKVVNQEVVERHVVGLCLQFLFLIIMWFLLRPRVVGNTNPPTGQTHVGNGHVKNGAVLCNGTDYRQQDGTIEDIENEENYLEECSPSKPLTPEATSDTKRRRRRKNRPNSVASEHSFDATSNQAQNFVSRTAGLLFHTQGTHDNVRTATKHAGSPRSQSNDSINSLSHDERKWNAKKSAFSPKSKKVFFRDKNDTDDGRRKTFADAGITGERSNAPGTKLVRSKSSGECYENKLALSDITLSTVDSRRSLANARCLLQPTSNPLKDQKKSWIWGFG